MIHTSGSDKTFTYDTAGNVLTMSEAGSTTTYTYDSEGRLLTKDVPVFGLQEYSYDGEALAMAEC